MTLWRCRLTSKIRVRLCARVWANTRPDRCSNALGCSSSSYLVVVRARSTTSDRPTVTAAADVRLESSTRLETRFTAPLTISKCCQRDRKPTRAGAPWTAPPSARDWLARHTRSQTDVPTGVKCISMRYSARPPARRTPAASTAAAAATAEDESKQRITTGGDGVVISEVGSQSNFRSSTTQLTESFRCHPKKNAKDCTSVANWVCVCRSSLLGVDERRLIP